MSFHVLFSFSVGLADPLRVPKGTLDDIQAHVRDVESTFGFETEQYKDNPPHWKTTEPQKAISDKVYCDTAAAHNSWVRRLYEMFGKWSETPVVDGEELTPAQAKTFWHALTILDVPPERWTADCYRERMEHLYEVMRGRDNEGVSFDEKPLTEKQAAQVINLFSGYLDTYDLRLDCPNGRDYLASSSDGGYDWCDKCGPMVWEDVSGCRKRGCPLRAEYNEERA